MVYIIKAAVLFLGTASATSVQREAAALVTNPIRKVVTMLQDMQTKVTEEGKKEQELYDKFMCYCKTSGGELDASIEAAETKVEAMEAALKGSTERKAQTEADLKEHQSSRAEAEDTMATATALREKAASEFSQEEADLKTNIAAVAKAVDALEKGAAGAFLQTTAANLVRSFAMEKANLPDSTRQELLSFLSGTEGEGYSPQSGEITGILKQLGDEMSKSLAESTDAESASIANYEALIAAKKKEVGTLQVQIENEMERVGRLGVETSEMANDIEDTKNALSADQKFQLELKSSCGTKTAEWEAIKMTRSEELVALAETIKVLNDDDALELFKKTLPVASSSFVQVQVNRASQRARALELVRTARRHTKSPALDLILLALRGKSAGFEKVITMVDQMVANLKTEQVGDDSKKEYCDTQLDQSEDKKKELEQSVADSSKSIDDMEGLLVTLVEEIKALEAGIKALDKSVVEAFEQRKAENDEFKALLAADSTAKEVLVWAKNRLNKFYNPKLYTAPAKRELSEEERITVNMGGTLAPTPAPGGIADTGIGASLVQIRAHSQVHRAAPQAPPETFGPYTKKGGETNGVIAMIDLLVKDLDKEMQEAEVSEKDAQADYQTMMADAGEKRAADLTSLNEKESAKANTEEELDSEKDSKAATTKELMGVDKYVSELHGECDWLLKYFEARKAARTSEIESLVNAKAVLSGADYALVQTARSGFLARRSQ